MTFGREEATSEFIGSLALLNGGGVEERMLLIESIWWLCIFSLSSLTRFRLLSGFFASAVTISVFFDHQAAVDPISPIKIILHALCQIVSHQFPSSHYHQR